MPKKSSNDDATIAALVAGLAGNASPELKEDVVLGWRTFGRGGGMYYSAEIASRVKPVRYDVFTVGGKSSAELECELVVGPDMLNGFGTLHGGCSAYLVDICPSMCLIPLIKGHVTLTLDIVCHAPAIEGTTLKIISKTTAIGARVLATRCEIYDKATGKPIVTGTHIKMPPRL